MTTEPEDAISGPDADVPREKVARPPVFALDPALREKPMNERPNTITPFPPWHPDGPPLQASPISHAWSWLDAANEPPEHYSLAEASDSAATPARPTWLQRLFPPGGLVSDAIWEAGTLLCRLGERLQRIRPETTAPAPTEPIFLIDHQTDFADSGAKPLTVKGD